MEDNWIEEGINGLAAFVEASGWNCDVACIHGPKNAKFRQQLMQACTGEKWPISKCGYTLVAKNLVWLAGSAGAINFNQCTAGVRSDLQKWLRSGCPIQGELAPYPAGLLPEYF